MRRQCSLYVESPAMFCEEVKLPSEYCLVFISEKNRERIKIFCGGPCQNIPFTFDSLEAAMGAAKVIKKEPFEDIEVHEYLGRCFSSRLDLHHIPLLGKTSHYTI